MAGRALRLQSPVREAEDDTSGPTRALFLRGFALSPRVRLLAVGINKGELLAVGRGGDDRWGGSVMLRRHDST